MNIRTYPSKIKEIEDIGRSLDLIDLTKYVTSMPKFALWTGSLDDKHHCGAGGLQYHTWEVITLSQNTALALRHVNLKVLFLAALYHDIGKIWDYKTIDNQIWVSADHKRLIHHISRSALEWNNARRNFDYYDDDDAVLHCILSHHGQREWGSPVAPKTREAWILHLCDGLSARCDDCERIDLIKNV